LAGKTLIVDAPNTAYALQMKKILLLKGMHAGKDYEIKPFGATPQRLIAMRERKENAGSMLGAAEFDCCQTRRLRQPWFRSGSYRAVSGRWLLYSACVGAGTSRRAGTYLAAIIEAQRWLMAPSNKQLVIELMIKESHLAPDAAVEGLRTQHDASGGYEKDAALDLEGFKNVLKLRAEVEGQWGGHPPGPEKYYDSSYYDAALAKLKGQSE